MRKLGVVVGVAVLMGVVSGWSQTTNILDFSYTFAATLGVGPGLTPLPAGTTVTGSLEGTQDGSLDDVIAVLNMSLDGTPVNGTFSIGSFTSSSTFISGGAVVSSDVTQNDFEFLDFVGVGSVDNLVFSMDPFFGGSDLAGAGDTELTTVGDSPIVQANWQLTAVPEPSTWAMVALGVVLGGLRLRRRAS